VTIGSDTLVTFSVNASDPDGDSLTNSYTTTGGNISGDGPNARWDLAGQNPGNYNATAQVNDGHGGTASCSASVTVNPRPNRPPTVSLSSDRDTVLVGECVNFTAVGLDPNGYSLTYTWVSNGGQITPSNTTARLCTTGVAPGSYTTTVRVDNGHDGAADASKAITVQAPPPPPQASKIGECAFGKPLSTRIDNVCKRILDDVALRLQNEPRASAVIIGYSDPKERRPGKIAGDRGTNAVKYLGEKGIDASRITTRTGAGQAGATNNRRIDVIYVPEGATY
jgi:outer membrane protein OmpA-like peptidoglycan-associated protein